MVRLLPPAPSACASLLPSPRVCSPPWAAKPRELWARPRAGLPTAGAGNLGLLQRLSSCVFRRPGPTSSREVPSTSLCQLYPSSSALGGGRALPCAGCAAALTSHRTGGPVSVIAWHGGCAHDATMRKGWARGKAMRTGTVKEKEGFGSLSGPSQTLHAGVWAEPKPPGASPRCACTGSFRNGRLDPKPPPWVAQHQLAAAGCGLLVPAGLALGARRVHGDRSLWLSCALCSHLELGTG